MKCLGIHLSCIESEYLEIDLGQTSFNAETKKKKNFRGVHLARAVAGKTEGVSSLTPGSEVIQSV